MISDVLPFYKYTFRFIDLFAGIGGLRQGLEAAGGHCVFSSEMNKHSQKTYSKWYSEIPAGDLTKIDPTTIPDHDVLSAGFPCQPFSLIGKLGGFQDTRGTLFFNICNVLEAKRPPVVLLENVPNLLAHDKKRTFATIKQALEQLGYVVMYKVVNSESYVPQRRKRVFIICFSKVAFSNHVPYKFPEPKEPKPVLRDILEPLPDDKYTLTERQWQYMQNRKWGYKIADLDKQTWTLLAGYGSCPFSILLEQKGKCPRKLTPREAARLMGFSDKLPIVVSEAQAYRQFGNAVVPQVAEALARCITDVLQMRFSVSGLRQHTMESQMRRAA